MRRAILYRYHKSPDVCRNHIALLRRFNPGMPIYGMYGGPRGEPPVLPLNHNYVLPFPSPRFKWLHGDLCARQWFIDAGHRFPFEMLHIVEWDLVILQSLAALFQNIRDGVAVMNVKTIATWRGFHWHWISGERGNAELKILRDYVRKAYGKTFSDDEQVAGIFPGACMSRAFLEGYAKVDPPAVCNDEVRMALFAQAMGMRVRDTRINVNNPYMACDRINFSALDIARIYPRERVFHHMREKLYLKAKQA